MGVDNTQYNLLYSLYSWPNVILSLIGGVLIDRWIGVRIGTVLFSVLVTVGQVCNVWHKSSFYTLLIPSL